ncbi:hypothetical protein FHW92_003933 [Novosphingobium sp. SG707]|nr:hypothetical protein [Novosphingobium sp. SG707]
MARLQSKPRWGVSLSRSMAPIMGGHARLSHCLSRLDKGRQAHRIQAVCSDLSGLKFILNMAKASLWGNLRRGHEALSKIQVHGLHFKLSIPAHGAIPGTTAPREGPIFPGPHSLSQPKVRNAGWYMYYGRKRFSFRWLRPHLLRLVHTVQRSTENQPYTYYSLKRLIFMLKLAAAPVRRVHYTYARFGRASDPPHGPVPCADRRLAWVAKRLALWDDSRKSGATASGGFGDSKAGDKAPRSKSPRVLRIGRPCRSEAPFLPLTNSVARAMQDVVRMR